MADLERFGVFHEEPSLALTAGAYTDTSDLRDTSRSHGKQFAVTNLTIRHGNTEVLDKSLRLTTPGDHFAEPIDLPVLLSKRTGPGAPRDKPFRPTQPAAKAGGNSGSLYSLFGPTDALLDTDATLGANSGRPYTQPADRFRNIYTSTPKRGGAGYPDQYRLLGGVPYSYEADEYQRARILEKGMKREARARIPAPFSGGARGASGTFTSDAELYGRPQAPSPHRGRSSPTGRPPWRPNNPPAKGRFCGQFSPPQYIPNPEPEAKPPALRAPDKEHKARPVRPFAPPSAGHKRLSMWTVNPYERAALSSTRPTEVDLL